MRRSFVLSLALLALTSTVAVAQDAAPADPWTGSLGLAYLATTGNSDTTTFGLDFTMKREPQPWGFEVVGAFLRNEEDGNKTAERYFAGVTGLRSIGARWDAKAGLSAERDRFAGVNQRLVLGVGVIYKAVRSDAHTLDLDAAATWTDEEQYVTDVLPDGSVVISTPSDTWIGADLGLSWKWQISESTTLGERLTLFPNFDATDDWRARSETGLQVAMSKRLALKLSYEVRYDNEPAPGIDDTDTTTKISLVIGL